MSAATDHTATAPAATLSNLLREGTRTEHEQAETMGFISTLMGGGFGDKGHAAYADLAAQQYAIYGALEKAGSQVRELDGGSAFVFDELLRTPQIEKDLAFLIGEDWASRIRILPETEHYVARLLEVGSWLGGYAAHAYTRYLGDLSGGQIIKVMMQRHYGFGEDGLAFYTFDQIPKVKVFKDMYRETLDTLQFVDDADRDRIVDEAKLAFRLNQDLFGALGDVHL